MALATALVAFVRPFSGTADRFGGLAESGTAIARVASARERILHGVRAPARSLALAIIDCPMDSSPRARAGRLGIYVVVASAHLRSGVRPSIHRRGRRRVGGSSRAISNSGFRFKRLIQIMKILRAKHLGMCFGVRDAIALALERRADAPLTIFGELVHNQTVLDSLRSRGVQIEENAASISTSTVMVTAHGASEKKMSELRDRKFTVIEATCPLVHFAHRAVREFVQAGFHPVIVGKRDHVEVRGLTEDLAEFDVVLSEADVQALQERPRFGIAAQTTQPIARVRHLVHLIRNRFPNSEIRFTDTVCQPTKQRQSAAVELAAQCDVVIVVGGANSNNTRELVATCREFCPRVCHVQSALDLQMEWLSQAKTVGITAGTSTPDNIIDAVEHHLQQLAAMLDECGAPANFFNGAMAKT